MIKTNLKMYHMLFSNLPKFSHRHSNTFFPMWVGYVILDIAAHHGEPPAYFDS